MSLPPIQFDRTITVPRGSGGGCVKTGPLHDWVVTMGPFDFGDALRDTIPAEFFTYHPRCLTRSLNNWVIETGNNQMVVELLLAAPNIVEFQRFMNAFPDSPMLLGPHGGGHLAPGPILFDVFSSPQDPAFWLHHGMVDRLWAIWQDADETTRRLALNGSNSLFYGPNSPLVALDTTMEFGVLDEPRPMGELMSPRNGRYCYSYT